MNKKPTRQAKTKEGATAPLSKRQIARLIRQQTSEDAVPPNTAKARRADWKCWATWCDDNGECPIPATVDGLTLYVEHLRGRGFKLATIQRRLATISGLHNAQKLPNPARDPELAAYLKAVAKQDRAPQDKAVAMSLKVLRRIVWKARQCDEKYRDIRDAEVLLYLLTWFCCARISETLPLKPSDIEFVDGGMVVQLVPGKTGARAAYVPRRGDSVCPVEAAEKVLGGEIGREYLFSSETSGWTPWNQTTVMRKMRTRLKGLRIKNWRDYSTHSFRAGCATELARSGANQWDIAEAGGWTPGSHVVHGYVRAERGVLNSALNRLMDRRKHPRLLDAGE